jgi:hypothetical protein
MQKSFLHLLVIIFSLLFAACNSKTAESGQKEVKNNQGVSIPDTIYSDNYAYALSLADKKCLADSQYLICEFGVTHIGSLGFPLDELEFEAEVKIKDTVFTQGGYQWRGKEIILADGSSVHLEGNFVDEGDPANQLEVSTVNRIRVESPLYQTPEGIKVGLSFGELKALIDEEQIVAIYIPSAKMVDLTVPEVSGLHFNLPLDTEIELQEGYQGKEIKIDIIPIQTPIHSIVVAF